MQTDEKPHDWDRSAAYCALGRKVNESMKKVIAPVLLLCLLTVTASAAYVPEEVVSENRDGRQLVVKTYVLSPEADPGELIEEPFELEGYTYHYLETIKEEQAFKDTRAQTEVVTVETETNDLADILRQLAPTMEYSKDGFSGTLTLDHTSLQTEAKGYTTKYYMEAEAPHMCASNSASRRKWNRRYSGRGGKAKLSVYSIVFRQVHIRLMHGMCTVTGSSLEPSITSMRSDR